MYIRDNKHNLIKCRALLDTCATANFISNSIVKRLGVRTVTQSIPISAINAMSSESKGVLQIMIQSTQSNYCKSLKCLTLPAIADLIPSEIFPRDTIKIPANIKLADPEFHLPRPIDLLIGSGATLSLFSFGQVNLSRNGHDLYLQKTQLGWVVAGSSARQNSIKPVSCCLTNLEAQLTKFWTIEEITTDKPLSEEDRECEAHFTKNVMRNDKGRYVVRLPFRNSDWRLTDYSTQAPIVVRT